MIFFFLDFFFFSFLDEEGYSHGLASWVSASGASVRDQPLVDSH